MIKIAILALNILLLTFTGIVLSGQMDETLPARLDQTIRQLMKQGEVPGLSIAVIQSARIVFLHSYGTKSLQTSEPVQADTIFEAASLSKPVFAYGVLKLAENGKLDLDAPLTQFLSEAYVKGDGRLKLITTRMVLSHTTGFPNSRPNGQPLRIHFQPGSRFSYSGEGFVYLQKVVEHLTGKSLNDFMTETVFNPLGMTNSSFVWQKKFLGKKACGHNNAGEAKPIRMPQEANAASSLNTTIEDYARFAVAVLNSRGLKASTLNEIMQPRVRIDERCKNCIDVSAPEKYSERLFWGLGWGLQKTNNEMSLWHWGDNNEEFHCYISANPTQQSGIVIFTNSGNGHSIIPEITSVATGEIHPAFAWMNYESYDSPLKIFLREIVAHGNEAINDYKNGGSRFGTFKEEEINRLGYWLLARKRMNEAIAVLKMNVERFPVSWNAHDSLGEAYMMKGERAPAIQSYKRSLELNPDNSNAAEMLKKLENTL